MPQGRDNSSPRAKCKPGKKRVTLPIVKKLELLAKLEQGKTVKQLCDEFGVSKQCVSDLKKQKVELRKFGAKHCDGLGGPNDSTPRKHMKPCKDIALDSAVLKWYIQHKSQGFNVRGVEILNAANQLAAKMKIEFKGSDGWLYRFRKRNGLRNVRVRGEAGSADLASVEPFKIKLKN